MKNTQAWKQAFDCFRRKKGLLLLSLLITLFGFSLLAIFLTVPDYDPIEVALQALPEGESNDLAFRNADRSPMSVDQVLSLQTRFPDLVVEPTFLGDLYLNYQESLSHQIPDAKKDLYRAWFSYGIEVGTPEELAEMGLAMMAGDLPHSDEEIAIPDYAYYVFQKYGFYGLPFLTGPSDLVGQTLFFNNDTDFVISGIVDTGLDLEYFLPVLGEPDDFLLVSEWSSVIDNGISNAVFFYPGFFEQRLLPGINFAFQDYEIGIQTGSLATQIAHLAKGYALPIAELASSVYYLGEVDQDYAGASDIVVPLGILSDIDPDIDWFMETTLVNLQFQYLVDEGVTEEQALAAITACYAEIDDDIYEGIPDTSEWEPGEYLDHYYSFLVDPQFSLFLDCPTGISGQALVEWSYQEYASGLDPYETTIHMEDADGVLTQKPVRIVGFTLEDTFSYMGVSDSYYQELQTLSTEGIYENVLVFTHDFDREETLELLDFIYGDPTDLSVTSRVFTRLNFAGKVMPTNYVMVFSICGSFFTLLGLVLTWIWFRKSEISGPNRVKVYLFEGIWLFGTLFLWSFPASALGVLWLNGQMADHFGFFFPVFFYSWKQPVGMFVLAIIATSLVMALSQRKILRKRKCWKD